MLTNEKAPFIAVNGARPIATNNLPNPRPFVKPIPKGRIENGVLVKKVRAENFFHKFQSWGVSQVVLENALERGAEYVEFRVDDGRRLRGRILDALNRGIRCQFKDYEPQIFLNNDLLRPVDDPQLSLFGGDGR